MGGYRTRPTGRSGFGDPRRSSNPQPFCSLSSQNRNDSFSYSIPVSQIQSFGGKETDIRVSDSENRSSTHLNKQRCLLLLTLFLLYDIQFWVGGVAESDKLSVGEENDEGFDNGCLPSFPHVLIASMSNFLFGYHIG